MSGDDNGFDEAYVEIIGPKGWWKRAGTYFSFELLGPLTLPRFSPPIPMGADANFIANFGRQIEARRWIPGDQWRIIPFSNFSGSQWFKRVFEVPQKTNDFLTVTLTLEPHRWLGMRNPTVVVSQSDTRPWSPRYPGTPW